MKKLLLISLLLTFCFSCSLAEFINEEDPLSRPLSVNLAEYIKLGTEAPLALRFAIIEQIEKNPQAATDYLLAQINAPNHSEPELAIYIWALGFTHNQAVVSELIKISQNNSSPVLKGNCLRSLAKIGGDQAGIHLISQIDTKQPINNQFDLLNLLAEMQYTPALPLMEPILNQNFKEFYWQLYFCFGKMGDKAIPFLLEKTHAENQNVRFNAIYSLAHILMAQEAASVLPLIYQQEKDPTIKKLILSSMEKITPNFLEMNAFFRGVVEKETDPQVKRFAQESLANIDQYYDFARSHKKSKKMGKNAFAVEYAKLFRSAGQEGNIKLLGVYSQPDNMEALKNLRRKILERNSLECIFTYQGVNDLIFMDRIITNNTL